MRSACLNWTLTVIVVVSGCNESNPPVAKPDHGTPDQPGLPVASLKLPSKPLLPPDSERGFETPEAAWQMFTQSKHDRDYTAYVGCLTLDSQKVDAAGLVLPLGFFAAMNEGEKDAVKALLSKHGLSNERTMMQPPPGITQDSTELERKRAIGSVFTDPAAFIVEALQYLEEHHASKSSSKPDQQLVSVDIDGETATGVLKERRGRKSIGFQKTDAGWLIQMTDSYLVVLNGVTTSGSGKADRFRMGRVSREKISPDKPLPVDQSFWHTAAVFSEVAADEALQQITTACGLSRYEQPEFDETLRQPVTINMTEVSPLQVIEEVCHQVGLHPRYKAGAMALSRGERTLPIAFAGPFLIETTQLQEYVPNAFVTVSFQIFAAGLPQSVSSVLQGKYIRGDQLQDALQVDIPTLSGGNGTQLRAEPQGFFPIEATTATVKGSFRMETDNVLRDVKSLAKFPGELSWPLPPKTKTVTAKDVSQDSTLNIDEFSITVKKAELNDKNSTLSLQLKGLTGEDLSGVARDENGKELPGARVSSMTMNGEPLVLFHAKGRIAAVDWTVVVERPRMTFAFTMPSIPLFNADSMPATLPELTFPNDAPVSVRFVRMQRKEGQPAAAIFEWTNDSNKDIAQISVGVTFVDDAEAELDDRRVAPSSSSRVLLEPGQTKETNLLGNGAPEGAVSAAAVIEEIEFTDGTKWTP